MSEREQGGEGERPSRFTYTDDVAAGYDTHRHGRGPYLPVLVNLAKRSDARRVLEIGCGTGRVTRELLAQHPCDLVGLDVSRGMLREAVSKGIDARWVQADAAKLPIKTDTFDFLFGVLALHHIRDLAALLAECRRVLRRGYAAFVTIPHEFIRNYPLNEYFPSFREIDLRRFPAVERVQQFMADAGFEELGVTHRVAEAVAIDAAYVKKIADKFVSTYRLIPEDEYKAGLERLQTDVARLGTLESPMEWHCAVVYGR